MSKKSDFGLIGLAVMGQNLALNIADHGFQISVYNRTTEKMDKFVADKKVDTEKVKVFYTTPPYYDYNWTVHADMPAATQDKLRQAFLDLKADSAEGKEVLALQRATRFVPTKVDNYKGIEAAARSAGLLK